MSFDASPPITSKYTRQMNIESRPKTPVTESLDESSLAAWWNIDKTMKLPNNSTPFRKQRYEPLQWANAHLLLDEDGADFLADDPFATPAPSRRLSLGAKKQSSARKRTSNVASGYPRAGRSSTGSHRDLTLADLTPRSRRLSGFRTKSVQRSRVSDAGTNIRPLRLSFNGPAFALSPRQDLQAIPEQHSPSPLLAAFRPLTPEKLSPARNHSVSPSKPAGRTPTRPRQSEPRSISARDATKQKRKSRSSIPTVQPTENEDSDDEELHKSIPGAFDFIASKPFQPELPTTVLQRKTPRKSNPQGRNSNKPRLSGPPPPAEPAPAPTAGGLVDVLAEYGSSLMGMIAPTVPKPPVEQAKKRSSVAQPSLKLSELSPKRTTSKDAPRSVTRKEVPPPEKHTKSRPSTKTSIVAPSRLQRSSQTSKSQVSSQPIGPGKEPPVISTLINITDVEHPIVQLSDIAEPTIPSVADKILKDLARPQSRPSSTVQSIVSSPVRERRCSVVTSHRDERPSPSRAGGSAASRPSSSRTNAEAPTERSHPRTLVARHILPVSPPPHRMRVDVPSPAKHVSPIKARPSTSAPRNKVVHEYPTTAVGTQPGDHPLKPILKKRALEVSPTKASVEGRAVKRQKVSDVKGKDRVLTVPIERAVPLADRGKDNEVREKGAAEGGDITARDKPRGRKTKMEQAPKKQARSRSRVNQEVPVVAPLVLSNVDTSELQARPTRSHSHERSRSHSRSGYRSSSHNDAYTENVEQDVFGAVMENSLEVVAVTRALENENLPLAVLESMSPMPSKRRAEVPNSRREQSRLENHQREVVRILQPSAAPNSPKRTRSPIRAVPPKPASIAPARADYRPPQLEDLSVNTFVQRPYHPLDRDDDEGHRLTIPFSPKAYMRPQRREEVREEPQRKAWNATSRNPTVQQRQKRPLMRGKQREIPPVAAALLAKLAGVEADLNRTTRERSTASRTTHQASHQFTFRAELRPVLGKEGAALADQALRQQFESRRNLWEQRSLEASQESRTSERARSTSRHGERRMFATEARAMEREARREARRQRDERLEWNRPPGGHFYQAW